MADTSVLSKPSHATKSYFIVPAILLAGFLVFQIDFQRKREHLQRIVAAEAAAARQADDAARAERQHLAAADAARRAEERAQREREREEAKRQEFDALLARIAGQASLHEKRAAALAASVFAAEQRLAVLRTQKEQTNREAFDLARSVELQRIDRRNAEIELQRMTRMLLAHVLHE